MWNNRMRLHFDIWKIHYLHLPCEVADFTVHSETTIRPNHHFHCTIKSHLFLCLYFIAFFENPSDIILYTELQYWSLLVISAASVSIGRVCYVQKKNTHYAGNCPRCWSRRNHVRIPCRARIFCAFNIPFFPVYSACFNVLLINGFRQNFVSKFLFEHKEWKLGFGSQRIFSSSRICPDLRWPHSLYNEATYNFLNFGKSRETHLGWHWSLGAYFPSLRLFCVPFIWKEKSLFFLRAAHTVVTSSTQLASHSFVTSHLARILLFVHPHIQRVYVLDIKRPEWEFHHCPF
jgi:hypothetical protein